jgi:hypothetical protein
MNFNVGPKRGKKLKFYSRQLEGGIILVRFSILHTTRLPKKTIRLFQLSLSYVGKKKINTL